MVLRKPRALTARRDFVRIQERGSRVARGSLKVLWATGTEGVRVGYTVSRRVGNAVIRNLVRRRLREVVRLHQELLVPGLDYVVVSTPLAATASYRALERDLTMLLDAVARAAKACG